MNCYGIDNNEDHADEDDNDDTDGDYADDADVDISGSMARIMMLQFSCCYM